MFEMMAYILDLTGHTNRTLSRHISGPGKRNIVDKFQHIGILEYSLHDVKFFCEKN